MTMNKITSEALDKCLEYSDIAKISATDYSTFVRALVYTMDKELPVELLDNATNSIIKVQLEFFSIAYSEGEEGSLDSLKMQYIVEGEEKVRTIEFERIGRNNVIKDRKSGTRTFYRYYIDSDKNKGYRVTFNRRISKN